MKRKRKSKPKVKRLTEAQTDELLARMERNLYKLEMENEAMRRSGKGGVSEDERAAHNL